MELNVSDALRYLGVKEGADGALHRQMTALAEELQSRIQPRFIWTRGDVSALALPGQMAGRLLADCHQAAVLVCTLGTQFDLWVKREQVRDMSRAVMLDALGSAYVEAACDAAEDEIRAHFPGMYLTDRFSPGYGDFPLTAQPMLLDYAGANRIGVTLTDSLLMTPQKSVSAVIGLSPVPQMARIRGCAHCAMNKTCNLRKAGTPCHV